MTQLRLPAHPFSNDTGPIVLAHRGFRGKYPENTLLAFKKAADLGVDGLEMDIHRTRDGTLVICHDATVDRTTNGSGPIKKMALVTLKQLDAGYRWTPDSGRTFPFRGLGFTIPTLEEIFVAFPHLWLNIDIKQVSPAIVPLFAKTIYQFGMVEKMMIGSFDTVTVKHFRRHCPQAATAAAESEARHLFMLSKLHLGRFYRKQAQAIQVPEWNGRVHVVTPRFIDDAHKAGTAVHVWTVNEIKQAQRLIDMSVDGLITDYPDRILRLLGR